MGTDDGTMKHPPAVDPRGRRRRERRPFEHVSGLAVEPLVCPYEKPPPARPRARRPEGPASSAPRGRHGRATRPASPSRARAHRCAGGTGPAARGSSRRGYDRGAPRVPVEDVGSAVLRRVVDQHVLDRGRRSARGHSRSSRRRRTPSCTSASRPRRAVTTRPSSRECSHGLSREPNLCGAMWRTRGHLRARVGHVVARLRRPARDAYFDEVAACSGVRKGVLSSRAPAAIRTGTGAFTSRSSSAPRRLHRPRPLRRARPPESVDSHGLFFLTGCPGRPQWPNSSRVARRRGRTVLADVDDLVFDPAAPRDPGADPPASGASGGAYEARLGRLRATLGAVDGVVVSTEPLADAAGVGQPPACGRPQRRRPARWSTRRRARAGTARDVRRRRRSPT